MWSAFTGWVSFIWRAKEVSRVLGYYFMNMSALAVGFIVGVIYSEHKNKKNK